MSQFPHDEFVKEYHPELYKTMVLLPLKMLLKPLILYHKRKGSIVELRS